MLRQEKLQSMKLLRNTFDVVQPINANDDFDALEALLELLNSVNNLLLFKVLHEVGGKSHVSGGEQASKTRH